MYVCIYLPWQKIVSPSGKKLNEKKGGTLYIVHFKLQAIVLNKI